MSSHGLACDAVTLAKISAFAPPAQHPVEAGEQRARHRHFGDGFAAPLDQPPIHPFHLRVVAHGHGGRFHQHPAQEGVALLAEVAELLSCSAGVLGRDQSGVAGHLARRGEPLHRPQREHHGERGDGTDAGLVAHQVAGLGGLFGLAQHHLVEAAQNPEARYLMRHQAGVGPITALTVVLTLGPVERFASARKVSSYAGLVPAEYSSGARQKLGHLSKEGNPFLRWVLVESATVAVRHDPGTKRTYWRLVERRGKAIAKVAMARTLLTRLYWMLRRRSEGRDLRQRDRVAGKPVA